MSKEELMALIELLARTPMTQAERLWIQAVIEREMGKAEAK
jgi:hypothetical protein